MKSGRFIGVMSGTSLDGVDVVLATIDEHRVAQLASLSWPIPVSLKQAVLDICQGQQLTLSQFGQLDTQLGRLFADAVNALLKEQNLQARDIVAIGCHGQTSGMNRRAWHHTLYRLAITIKLWHAPELRLSVIFAVAILPWEDKAHRWYLRSIMPCWLTQPSDEWCSILAASPICHCSFLGSRLAATIRSW